ncbi:MAG: Eco57I restriction-modification methylase domain-containing protein [Lewinellaceae bacterium]|nr:Eco57I restriction-modification methylase domain-containing protein [Lewinellaceae bacterium]
MGKKIVKQADFLDTQPGKFDIVIGNPPYVRHEQIPEPRKSLYKRKFSTFRHRSDLYIPFYEHALKLLNFEGKLCFICSNRWLRNQYGGTLSGS